jgi:ribosomal protein L29
MKKQLEKDIKTLESLDASELSKEIAKAEKELFLMNIKNRSNELKQPHAIGNQKKYLAKLYMVKAHI